MRISKTFGERKHVLTSDNPKREYFFAYEGSETERLYFDGIQALHFDEVFALDMEKVKTNVRVTEKRKYTEDELRKLVPGYKKNNIQFQVFVSRIDKAISNEKQFAEELSDLKVTVGSNVGKLITQLR